MKKHNFLGKLTKEERVSPVGSKLFPKSMIIDIPNPLAMYYSDIKNEDKPNSIVVITKMPCSLEDILRINKKLNKAKNFNVDAAKCEVKIGKTRFYGLRLKRINSYMDIDDILDFYAKEGFEFNINRKIKNGEIATIRVNKFFDVEEISKTILRSRSNKDEYYFLLEKSISWKKFKEKTISVKYNISSSGYDIAKTILYNQGEINDIVRVVKPNLSLDLVKEIEAKYKQ